MYRLLSFLICCVLLVQPKAWSQQCTGPGEPVAVIDFGSAETPFSVAGKIGPGYGSTQEECTPEKSIALRTKAFRCNPDWHVVTGDHTPRDVEGNFLMVNAAEGNSEVFRDTVAGLCPGSIFYAEAWVVNLIRKAACEGNGGNPDLVFALTDMAGNKVFEGKSGSLAKTDAGSWVPVRFQFLSPADGKVVLTILNLNGVKCGSDFGIDDISFSPCSRNFAVSVQGAASGPLETCQERQTPVLLQANINGFNNPDLQWQVNPNDSGWQDIPGARSAGFLRQPSHWGIYRYRVRIDENGNAGCRFFSDETQMVINPQPFAQGTNYVFGCFGFPFKFQGAGGHQYLWSGPRGFQSTEQAPIIPSLEFYHAGKYIVKVTTLAGCIGYDSTDLVVYDAPVGSINLHDTAICLGDSVQLQAGGAENFLWEPAIGLSSDKVANPVASPEKTTSYTVTIFKERTCYDTAYVTIRILPRPAAFAGPDQYVLKNRPVQLNGSVTGDDALRFSWKPGDKLNNPNILRPQARLTETTVFRLEATAGNGCGTATDEVKIEVLEGLHTPTAFSPNSDFLNEVWEIIGFTEYPNATVRLFNRWGQQVYQSTAKNYQPWNGKVKGVEAPPGLYVYTLDLGNGSPLRKGTLTLIK